MDIEMDNLKSELVLWYGVDPASQRDQFEAAATHGYSDEATKFSPTSTAPPPTPATAC